MAVNKDLALPKTPIAHVACRPSTFDYLPPVTQEKKEEVCVHAHARKHELLWGTFDLQDVGVEFAYSPFNLPGFPSSYHAEDEMELQMLGAV
eukprot:1139475-Pelagomonas_calceolata.AAC.9